MTPTSLHKFKKSSLAKTLTFHNVLMDAIKESNPKKTTKKLGFLAYCGSNLAKYKLGWMAGRALGLSQRRRAVRQYMSRESKAKFLVTNFFFSDDASRATAGMKETITRKKVKLQKRYLLRPMKKLWSIFCRKHKNVKVSYATFTRYRPFNVVPTSADNRDTCLCIAHVNMTFLAKKMKELGLIECDDPHEIVKGIVCSKRQIRCMYDNCDGCRNRNVALLPSIFQNDDQCEWNAWENITETRTFLKGGQKITKPVKCSKKVTKIGTIHELVDLFQKKILTFKRHIFNIKTQNEAFNKCKETLDSSSAVIIIDFSENYQCKLSSEIQSFHFGGSRAQATIHTGVIYLGHRRPIPFATISDCLQHGPTAIWAHLDPILKYLTTEVPELRIIHFFSDGPSTQYRQKTNFYLYAQKMNELGFISTWSFFEAGHGKNAADGVGGLIKRLANQKVADGDDIPDARTLYNAVKEETSIKLYFVTEEAIEEVAKSVPLQIIPVKGTQKIHQICPQSSTAILHREAACFCEANTFVREQYCPCYHFSQASLVSSKKKEPLPEKDEWSSSSENEQEFVPDDRSSDLNSYPSEDVDTDQPILQPYSEEKIKEGTHILVQIMGGHRNKSQFRYVAVCMGQLDNNYEVKVMFYKAAAEENSLFTINEDDSSYISENQILGVLPQPEIKMKGKRIYYKFLSSIDVKESGGTKTALE